MFRTFLVAVIILVAGCEAVPVQDASAIRTKAKLDESVALPVNFPVAYYVEKGEPDKGINFYGKLEEVSQLVMADLFSAAEQLDADSEFQYLFKLKSVSTWDQVWGGWKSELWLEAINRQGETIYSSNASKSASGAGLYDFNAVHNSLATVTKELLIGFLNNQGQASLAAASQGFNQNPSVRADLSMLVKDLAPENTGTGFFVNGQGDLATASHVVDDCLYVEIMHKGEAVASNVKHASKLLDLAVVETGLTNQKYASISKQNTQASLGKQVFVTGFPLSGILADYPSLTVGNISSLGGLKGAANTFQFSAPVQPGNSGGAIVDYKGNLVGLVSSSLNQSMLLKKTGTTAQNVNFGIDLTLLKKFFDKHDILYNVAESNGNFEQASADAVDYTTQVLCYK